MSFNRPRTPEEKARISASLKATLASNPTLRLIRSPWGRVLSERTRRKISASHFGLRHTEESKRKMSESKRGMPSPHPPEFYVELGRRMKGRVVSAETRQKLSQAGMGHPAYHASTRWFWYGDIRMRSSYEIRVATALDELEVPWEYEPKRFELGGRSNYTPDFYLPNDDAYWEVKGWFNAESQRKIKMFRQLYPDIPLIVFDLTCVRMLEASAHARSAA